MTISITIDGDEFPVLINSLSAQLNAGLGGVELNASVTNLGVSPPNPASNSKVELSLGGLDFVCRLSRVTEDTKGRLCVYQLSASGPQERLRRAAPAIDIRTTTGASSLLVSLVGGTGLGSSIPDDKDVVGGFASGGTVIDSIERLCGAANMVSYLAPDGTVYLYDRDNLPNAPFDWIVDDVATLISGLKKTAQSELPITRTVVHGGVKLDFEGQDPEETRTLPFNGDGSTKWFNYPSITDEITDIRVASTSQTVTYHGSGLDESTFDVVNYRNEYRLFWNTAPPSGTGNIEIDITIQRATAQADDLTTQADLASKFTDWDGVVIDEYQDENIRTYDQALQVAQSRLAQLNTSRREASAPVESGSLFLPCRKLTVTDPRTNWNYVLFVQSNSLQWDTGNNRWKQQVTVTNSLPGGAGGGGLAGVGRALARGATRPPGSTKSPPRESSGASPSFTIAIDPASRTTTGGGSSALSYTVTVTGAGGFTDPVTLTASGLPGCTFSFAPSVVIPGNDSTLTVTPTDGTWTDGDTDEEGTFTVTGTSGSRTASDTGTISITPGCEPGTFDHFVFSADCSGVPSNCCDLPFFPDQVAISWSVEFFDTCGNSMSTDEGIMYISQGASCTVVENGENTFSNPYTGITYSVLEEGGADCNCIVA